MSAPPKIVLCIKENGLSERWRFFLLVIGHTRYIKTREIYAVFENVKIPKWKIPPSQIFCKRKNGDQVKLCACKRFLNFIFLWLLHVTKSWNQHKNLRFFNTWYDLCQGKNTYQKSFYNNWHRNDHGKRTAQNAGKCLCENTLEFFCQSENKWRIVILKNFIKITVP